MLPENIIAVNSGQPIYASTCIYRFTDNSPEQKLNNSVDPWYLKVHSGYDNDVMIMYCDSRGNFIVMPCNIQKRFRQRFKGMKVWSDGRVCLLTTEHDTHGELSLWELSGMKYMCQFINNGTEIEEQLCEMERTINSDATKEDIRAMFLRLFEQRLEELEKYKSIRQYRLVL